MSVKGNSSIEEVSKSLKKKGVSVSNEALSVIIDTAFPELMEHVVKLNETVMKLGEDIAKLTELNASSNAELQHGEAVGGEEANRRGEKKVKRKA